MKWNSKLYDSKHDFVAEYGKDLLEFIQDDRTQKILDLGCGTGVLTAEIAKLCDYVLGIDSSSEMIEKARQAYPNLDFQVMDALEIPCEQKWDVVFSNAVFHWISNHDLLLRKIKDSLKSPGKLICEFGAYGNIKIIEQGFSAVLQDMGITYNSRFTFPTVDTFSQLLIKNGFSIKKIYDFDRPTPLKNGNKGLYNWAMQFFEADLERFSASEQNLILKNLMAKVRDELWNGTCWIADYRRLRVIADV
ncbi:MAG: methyltransferase domain-containing protein [Clostridium sp.]|uniref:class I SAM-dependent methyltransferase n=1 Tax=Clostridium sp. TaxID=1506 RepID=UPI0025C00A44|nr:class I SAM-dependent methyltransferase [Clostridium sp.]MCH3963889.1 methyltransferase domain-containing protein [Clostridium sp.]MCI1717008.1 methyltransferase domain-containing protein [Clostridium sp.]MCI1801273.1 methyltransferase domain-containing protein [Clostridium sp.]MCI1815119.1 methyltransferase domain-containing protein [Clostridium sp.]MCI1872097.1 methyltransferase domain-containing protein [Clostridium sp.]